MEPNVTITVYGSPSCSHCTVLKNRLKKAGVNFTAEFNFSKIMEAAQRAGLQSMPIVEIDGELFDDGGALKKLSTMGILV